MPKLTTGYDPEAPTVYSQPVSLSYILILFHFYILGLPSARYLRSLSHFQNSARISWLFRISCTSNTSQASRFTQKNTRSHANLYVWNIEILCQHFEFKTVFCVLLSMFNSQQPIPFLPFKELECSVGPDTTPFIWVRLIQSIPFHPVSLLFVLILFSYHSMRIQSSFLPLIFPTKIVSPIRAVCITHFSVLDFNIRGIDCHDWDFSFLILFVYANYRLIDYVLTHNYRF